MLSWWTHPGTQLTTKTLDMFRSLKLSFPWIPHCNFILNDLYQWQVALSISPHNPINFHYPTLKREHTERGTEYKSPAKYFPRQCRWNMQNYYTGSSRWQLQPWTLMVWPDIRSFPPGKVPCPAEQVQNWGQDKRLPTKVSGSPGFKLQSGGALAEENLGPRLEHFWLLGPPGEGYHIGVEFPRPHLDWSGSMRHNITERLKWKESYSSDGETVAQWSEDSCPKSCLAAKDSQGRTHTHFFNTTAVSFLLSNAISPSSTFRTGSTWGHSRA